MIGAYASALIGAALVVVLQHVLPLLLDDFRVLHQDGRFVKRFTHGWPLAYSSGPVEPSSPTDIACALIVNYVVLACIALGVVMIVRFLVMRTGSRHPGLGSDN